MFLDPTSGLGDRPGWHGQLSTDLHGHRFVGKYEKHHPLVVTWAVGGHMMLKPANFRKQASDQ